MTGLMLPNPAEITAAQLHNLCAMTVQQAQLTDDIGEVKDMAAKWSAIDEYVARTSIEGRAEIAATLRRLELRIGVLLGPGKRGNPNGQLRSGAQLDRDQRRKFRQLAAHPDIVEDIIAASTDETPATRKRILDEIANHVAERDTREQELQEELSQRGLVPITDPYQIAREQHLSQLRGSFKVAVDEILHLRNSMSDSDVLLLTSDRLWPRLAETARTASDFLNVITSKEHQ